jgi:exodeoxyribonuclease VIII
MTTFTNGVHDIDNDTYHSNKALSRSALWKFKKTPYHYWSEYINKSYTPLDMTPSLILGDLVHTLALEPLEASKRYAVAPNVDKRYKEGKAMWKEFVEQAGDRQVVTVDQNEAAKEMAATLLADDIFPELVEGAQIEKSIFFTHEATGLQCKVRPDAWVGSVITDLKTTADATYRSFQHSALKYGYFLQAGMMHQALKSLNIELDQFVFACVENTEPYAVATFILDDEAIDYGVSMFNDLMFRMAACIETNTWEAYGLQSLSVPAYALGE